MQQIGDRRIVGQGSGNDDIGALAFALQARAEIDRRAIGKREALPAIVPRVMPSKQEKKGHSGVAQNPQFLREV